MLKPEAGSTGPCRGYLVGKGGVRPSAQKTKIKNFLVGSLYRNGEFPALLYRND